MKGPRVSRATRRQRVANRFGLLVVLLMLCSSIYATVGTIEPVAAAPQSAGQSSLESKASLAALQDDGEDDSGDDQGDNADSSDGQGDAQDGTDDSSDGQGDAQDGTDDSSDGQNGNDGSSDGQNGYQGEDVTVGILILKFDCPSDSSGTSGGAEAWYGACGNYPQQGISFDLYNSQSNNPVDSDTTGGSGQAGWNNLDPDYYAVLEHVPDGYGAPVVFCGYGSDQNSVNQYDSWSVEDDSYVQLDLTSNPFVVCLWFNQATTTGNYGTVVIYKYDCPADWSPEGDTVRDYYDACGNYPHQDIDFDLYKGQDSNPVDSDTTDNNGEAGWDDLDADSYRIEEHVPNGYGAPVVFCGFGNNGEEIDQYQSWTVESGNSIVFDSSKYQYYECYWFNLPTDDYGSITIYKYFCNETHLVRGEWGYDDYQQYCHGSLDDYDILFEVTGSDDVPSSQQVGDKIDDGIYWEEDQDYAPGEVTIKEYPTEGFGNAVVYCNIVPPGTDAPVEPEQYDLTDLTLQQHLEPGQQFVCYWYNLPDYNRITIYKYSCPDDFIVPTDGSAQPFFDSCVDYMNGVDFNLSSTDGYDEDGTTGQNDDNIDGMVYFDSLEPGNYTITEDIPDGYGDPWVSCFPDFTVLTSGSGSDSSARMLDPGASMATGGRYDLDYQNGGAIVCYWFNLPTTWTITIYKYWCDDYQGTYAFDSLWDYCSNNWYNGVDFKIEGPDGYANSGETEDGHVDFPLASGDAGTYSITENIPDGYGDPYWYCTYRGPDDVASISDDTQQASGGAWDVEYSQSGHLYCYVFNVPTTWTITIYKYWCEDDYQPSDYQLDTLWSDCGDNWYSDIDFDITDGNNYSDSATTDDEGKASFTLPSGDNATYTLTETLPDGYGDPYWYCTYQGPDDVANISDDTQQASGGSWDVEYSQSGHLYCYVFNFKTTWTITIVKYFCRDGYTGTDYGFDAVYQECGNEEFSGFDFDIAGPNGYSDSGTTEDDGQVSFALLSGDVATYTITEAPTDGYGTPYWYCTYQAPDSIDQFTDDLQPATNGSWDVEYSQSGHLYCYVYNFPTTWTITIYKYWCEDDYQPSTYQFDSLWQDCGDNWYSDIDFDITDGGSYSDSATTDDNGQASFSLPSGDSATYTLTEQIPDGYGDPYWYCTYLGPDDVANVSDQAQQAASGSWDVEYSQSGHLYCYVFNFKTTWTITIYKYWCADDYQPESSQFDSLWAECSTNWYDGVYFEIEGPDGYSNDGTTADGHVDFALDSGDSATYTLTETIPTGYGEPYWYCTYQGPDDVASITDTLQQGSDGSWDVEYSQSGHLYCYVFNLADTWTITIFKYNCDSGYTPESYQFSTLYEDCGDTWYNGASFDIEGDNGYSNDGVTGDSGDGMLSVSLDSGDAATYTFTESMTSGYGNPYWYCTYERPGEVASISDEASEAVDGSWSYSYSEPRHLYCYVFNFPTGHDVIIYKYFCDTGYQESMATLNWYRSFCTTTRSGTVISFDGEEKTIGDNNQMYVWYDDVEPGQSYTIGETYQEGYYTPVVYCGLVPFDGSQPTQWDAAAVSEDWTWEYSVEEGYQLVCYVFNIPTGHDVVIYKFICPWGYDYENASIDELRENCEVVTIPIPFDLYSGNVKLASQSTNSVINGGVVFQTDATDLSITENVSTGYLEPRVFCRVQDQAPDTSPILYTAEDDLEEMTVDGKTVSFGDEFSGSSESYASWWCEWFNFEAQDDDNTVTIHKWECPVLEEGAPFDDSLGWLQEYCTQVHPGVTFTLDDLSGSSSKDTDNSGQVSWDSVVNGPIKITETIPDGYGEPTVYCGWTATYGNPPAVIDAFPQKVDSPNGVVTTTLDYPNTQYFCDWFNWPEQPGDITIYKWNCPEGYDLYGWGANPKVDCTQKANGITFTLAGGSGSVSAVTGDSMDSAVYWGGVEPGDYTVTEDVPGGTDYVFVLHCDGARFPGIQPYPLQFGNVLDVKVVSASHIICDWYNVPQPNDGWVTVYKYWCTTKTYKSDVDCQIYEEGVQFELWQHSGSKVSSGTTNGVGKLSFYGLDQGNYDLKEPYWKWCAIDIGKKGPDDSIAVQSGQETVVKVYNCDLPDKPGGSGDPGKPGKPGNPNIPTKPAPKQPTKYPNTGVNPEAFSLPSTGVGPMTDSTGNTIIALLAGMALVLVVAGLAIGRQTSDPVPPAPETTGRRVSLRRRPAVLAASALAVIAPAWVAAQGNNPPPAGDDDDAGDGSDPVAAGTPTVPACRVDIPDGATPEADEECIRGEVPKHIAIEAIGVDADIEIQEIIDGALQDPTGPTLVTWYKETSRLGERGNGVYAGHLNYWGVPEGVFFAIKTLQAGDLIELTGQNDEVFRYAVVWVENQPGQEEPDAEVLGVTEEESITLITCGGEWDTTIAEYNERTTVRAVRQEEEVAAA